MLVDALSNAAYRLLLRGPEAELEGVSTTSLENLEAHQGAGPYRGFPLYPRPHMGVERIPSRFFVRIGVRTDPLSFFRE